MVGVLYARFSTVFPVNVTSRLLLRKNQAKMLRESRDVCRIDAWSMVCMPFPCNPLRQRHFLVSMLLQLTLLPSTFLYLCKQTLLLVLQVEMLRDGRDVVGLMEGWRFICPF